MLVVHVDGLRHQTSKSDRVSPLDFLIKGIGIITRDPLVGVEFEVLDGSFFVAYLFDVLAVLQDLLYLEEAENTTFAGAITAKENGYLKALLVGCL
jgi:hypothetical protein